ncbi:MAG TPA: M15 family metallopeptidase [Bryobacteraceae bacterium]|jgi:hypothetical protein
MRVVRVLVLLAIAWIAPAQSPLSPAARAAMTGVSWKPGCPVPLDDLVAVKVKYLGFDGSRHEGTVVVNKRFADDIVHIFADLYGIHFAIHKISPWENYGEDKYAEQDITTGYYCEKADDAPDQWSSHAYGIAVDINPLENPFRDKHKPWWPKGSAQFAIRDRGRGKVTSESGVVGIFAKYGWAWGGVEKDETDYMHFNKKTNRRELEVK